LFSCYRFVSLFCSEDFVLVDGRKVYYRIVGDARKERKAKVLPVLCLGDLGLGMGATESLDLLAITQRRIIRIDSLGAGDSSPLPIFQKGGSLDELTSIAANEVHAVLAKLGIGAKSVDRFHVFCSGHGVNVAAALIGASGKTPGVSQTIDPEHILPVASIAVEPSNLLNVGDLPICAADGVARGNPAVLALLQKEVSVRSQASAGSSQAVRAFRSAGIPVLSLVPDAEAEAAAGDVQQAVISGLTGTPHLDQPTETLEALDAFYVNAEAPQEVSSNS
jgi:hypothetical protein